MIRATLCQHDPAIKGVLIKRSAHLQIDGQTFEPTAEDPIVESVLHVAGSRVVHCNLASNYVYQTWSFTPADTNSILQVIWVSFEHFPEQWLVVLVSGYLCILFGCDGSRVELPLAVEAKALWKFLDGLLIEPQHSKRDIRSCARMKTLKDHVLSLRHPLDELKAVLCADGQVAFNAEEGILYSDMRHLVTFDGNAHSLWQIVKTRAGKISRKTPTTCKDGDKTQAARSYGGYLSPEQPGSPGCCPFGRESLAIGCEQLGDLAHECADDITFRQLHRLNATAAARKIVPAKDAHGNELVCLLIGYNLIGVDAACGATFAISDCCDAESVAATEDSSILDLIIVRNSDRSLHVYRGDIPMACLSLPGLSSVSWPLSPTSLARINCAWDKIEETISSNPIEIARVSGLSHAAGSCVTLHLNSGDPVKSDLLRVEVSLHSKHPGVQACLAALETALQPALSLTLRATVLSAGGGWSAFRFITESLFGQERTCSESESHISPWQALTSSDYHVDFVPHCMQRPCRHRASVPNADADFSSSTFLHSKLRQKVDTAKLSDMAVCMDRTAHTLRLVCEELKLNVLLWNLVGPLERLLSKLCKNVDRHGQQTTHEIWEDGKGHSAQSSLIDIHEWFRGVVKNGQCQHRLVTLPERLPNGVRAPGMRARRLASIYSSLSCSDSSGSGVRGNVAYALVHSLVDHGITAHELSTWPPGFAIPMHDAIFVARVKPGIGWLPKYYAFIGRHDLARLQQDAYRQIQTHQQGKEPQNTFLSICATEQTNDSRDSLSSAQDDMKSADFDGYIASNDTGKTAMLLTSAKCGLSPGSSTNDTGDLDYEAVCLIDSSMILRSVCDACSVREVCRYLQSSRPVNIFVERTPEMSDHDYERKKHEVLHLACLRSCAAPCGRGMFTLGSRSHDEFSAEALQIPTMSFSGKVVQSNVLISVDTRAVELLGKWIHFHNGVASGLRIFDKNGITASRDSSPASARARLVKRNSVTRTWILYNRPDAPSEEHAGLLLALGLQQRLDVLTMHDIYEYLASAHETTTVAILLGMSASKLGSGDAAVTRMVCLHIPALLPQPFTDIEVTQTVHAAAVAGIGLLYIGTADRMMTEFLLNVVVGSIHTDHGRGSESCVLAAGIALGMVVLGYGPSYEAHGLGDLHIMQRLHHAMTGVREKQSCWFPRQLRRVRESYGDVYSDSISLIGTEKHVCINHQYFPCRSYPGSTRQEVGCKTRYITCNQRCFVNTALSSPGATLAMGLFFLQSNYAPAARKVKLPDTHFLLDTVRPDSLLVRIVARSLILWDAIVASPRWVEDQLPIFLRGSVGKGVTSADTRRGEPDKRESFDRYGSRQAYSHALAGACFALGLKFAGTGCKAAAILLLKNLEEFKTYRASFASSKVADGAEDSRLPQLRGQLFYVDDSAATALRPDRSTVEMVISTIAIALAMVMAGTCDVNTLRVIRELRRRNDEEVAFGTHQAIHSAIGLLFLGAGRASLSRSKLAVAALLCAFYPRVPQSADDNRYHLQALRHLWVLAVSWRSLEAVDVSSNVSIPVPLTIGLKPLTDWAPPRAELNITAPCLAPPTGDISWIRVASDRYHDVELSFQNQENVGENRRLTIYVKLRTNQFCAAHDIGYFPQVGDASKFVRSAATWHCASGVGSGRTQSAELLNFHPDDAFLIMFARFCCAEGMQGNADHEQMQGPRLPLFTGNWTSQVLHECIAADKPHILALYIQIYHYANILRLSANPLQAWSLRLVFDYFDSESKLRKGLSSCCILRPAFVEALRVHLDSILESYDWRGMSDSTVHPEFKRRVILCKRVLADAVVPTYLQ